MHSQKHSSKPDRARAFVDGMRCPCAGCIANVQARAKRTAGFCAPLPCNIRAWCGPRLLGVRRRPAGSGCESPRRSMLHMQIAHDPLHPVLAHAGTVGKEGLASKPDHRIKPFCRGCGQDMAAWADFCNSCGHKVESRAVFVAFLFVFIAVCSPKVCGCEFESCS